MSPRLLALWLKETIALLRDRHGLLALFIMPTHVHPGHDHGAARCLHAGRQHRCRYVVVDLDQSAHSKV
jgi:ABC-2 type transport system permease protein